MMTNEPSNIPDNAQLLTDIEQIYSRETLPELLPQQQLMLHYIICGDNYTDAYKKAGYTCLDHAKQAAWQLVTRNPLKAHIDYYFKELSKIITPEYIKARLQYISERALQDDRQLETGIKALAEINKMQGNYANNGQTNIQINTSIEDIRRAKSEYIKDK
jgi:phage terminase small subunit